MAILLSQQLMQIQPVPASSSTNFDQSLWRDRSFAAIQIDFVFIYKVSLRIKPVHGHFTENPEPDPPWADKWK